MSGLRPSGPNKHPSKRNDYDRKRRADAVWDLFRDVFGIQKTSVRVVIGVASLPLGVPIGLDVIFEVAE